jgi:hypothetical protein
MGQNVLSDPHTLKLPSTIRFYTYQMRVNANTLPYQYERMEPNISSSDIQRA